MSERRLKDIPKLDRDGKNLPAVLEALAEVAQTFRGYRGDPLDMAVTYRDLDEQSALRLNAVRGNGRPPGTIFLPGPAVDTGFDRTPPPTPTGLEVAAAITNLIISTDDPVFTQGGGHSRTRVYGATYSGTGPQPTFADAVEITSFPGSIHSYATNPSTQWHIWAKWETRAEVLSVDPAGGLHGIVAVTGEDVGLLLTALAGSITSSELSTSLNTSINKIAPLELNVSRIEYTKLDPLIGDSRIFDRDISTLHDLITRLALKAEKVDGVIRDAGIFVDPAAGTVTFVALQQTNEAVNNVSVRLDAAESTINLKASVAYVDTAIAEAVLDPSALPVFTALDLRLTQAEIDIDGAEAAILLKADAALVNSYGVRLNTAEVDIDALDSAVSLKASSTTVSAIDSRLATAESTITALGDQASSVRALQVSTFKLDADAAADAGNNLAAILAAYDAGKYAEQALALFREEIVAKVNTDVSAEVTARTELGARVATAEAQIVSEQTVRASGDAALASDITVLQATTGATNTALTAYISSETTARVDGDQILTRKTDLMVSDNFGFAARVAANADTSLAAIMAAYQAETGTLAALAAAREELTTKINADIEAEAKKSLELAARLGTTEALLTSEQLARVTQDTALASSITTLTTTVGNNQSTVQDQISSLTTSQSTTATALTTVQSQIKVRPNLVPNSSFELGFEGITFIGASAGWVTGNDVWGKVAYKNGGPDGVFGLMWPPFAVAAGDTYTLSAESVMVAASGGTWVDLEWKNAGGGTISYSPAAVVSVPHPFDDAGINRAAHTIAVVAPPGATSAVFRFVIASVVGNTTTGVRRVKVEKGGLPATLYTADQSASAIGASVQQEITTRVTQNTVLAKYAVKLDTNGHVAGFGVTQELGIDAVAPVSTFIANVDRFAVTTPASSVLAWQPSTAYALNTMRGLVGVTDKVLVCKQAGTSSATTPSLAGSVGTIVIDGTVRWQIASRVPFAVLTSPSTINGVAVPAGVYIDAAYVLNATIQTAQIANLAVDDSKIAEVSVAKLLAGELRVGAFIKSTNYVANTSGFYIDHTGYAEFQNAMVRGTIYATAGLIGGIQIFGGQIRSAGYVSGSAGFAILANGDVEFNQGSFNNIYARGNIQATSLLAATGTFTGSLSAATGTFNGTLAVGSAAISGTTMTGAGARINDSGTFAMGNAAGNITYNGSQLTLNGPVVSTANLEPNSVTTTAGASLTTDVPINSAVTQILAITVDTGGAPLFVSGTYRLGYLGADGASRCDVTIRVNGTVHTAVAHFSSNGASHVGAISAYLPSPPTGTLTIQLAAALAPDYVALAGTCSLFAIGCKR